MTVELPQSVLFGEEPEIPETIEQARERAARAGSERLTTIDSDSELNPIQEDLGWRVGSGTDYDNLPIVEGAREARQSREIEGLSGRDQERIIRNRLGEPTRRDAEVTGRHITSVSDLSRPALRATIAFMADGNKSLEAALLRNHGLEVLNTDEQSR